MCHVPGVPLDHQQVKFISRLPWQLEPLAPILTSGVRRIDPQDPLSYLTVYISIVKFSKHVTNTYMRFFLFCFVSFHCFEREKHRCDRTEPTTFVCALPDQESKPRPFDLWVHAPTIWATLARAHTWGSEAESSTRLFSSSSSWQTLHCMLSSSK